MLLYLVKDPITSRDIRERLMEGNKKYINI